MQRITEKRCYIGSSPKSIKKQMPQRTDEQRHFTKEKKTTQKITFHHIRNSNAFNTHLSAHCVLAVSPRVQKQRGNRAPAIHSSGTHRTLNGESARKTIKEVKRLEVTRLEVTGRVFLDHQGS